MLSDMSPETKALRVELPSYFNPSLVIAFPLDNRPLWKATFMGKIAQTLRTAYDY